MPKFIDTHSHLHFKQYDDDREEVIARMREIGVQTIAVGTDLQTSKQAIALADKYPDTIVGVTVGVHPNDTDEKFDKNIFTKLLNIEARPLCSGVVGVGECGLDYFRSSSAKVAKDKQEKNFRLQIEFALEHDLPLMLHIRDAHEDALEILKDYSQHRGQASMLRGTCHFFTGDAEIAMKYVELGFHISFPGVITFAPECRDAVRTVPLERILSETDAPYVAPVPFRGKRNEPIYVEEVVKMIAEIRRENFELVREQLIDNAKNLFNF